MRIRSAFTVCFAPSAPVTSTVPAFTIRPFPLKCSTLFFLKRPPTPVVSCFTTSALRDIIVPRSSERFPTLIPCLSRPCLIAAYSSEESSSALEGMHPTFKHVPPRYSFSPQPVRTRSHPARIDETYQPDH